LDVSIKLSKSSLSKEQQYINSALHSDAKGIILFPGDNEECNEMLVKLSASRYPITIIDRHVENINSSFISTDNYNAMVKAVEFLHSKNYQSALYVTSPQNLATTVKERLNGYKDGLKKYYGSENESGVLTVNNFSFNEIYTGVVEYLKTHPKTEVIIVVGWQAATDAVIAAVNALQMSIPKDVRLMLFDCDFSSTEIKLLQPYVIQQDGYQIGYKAAATLYNQIYGDLRAETVRLPIEILDYTDPEES
jgi:GntR family transcriptional regulator of arabinose operon